MGRRPCATSAGVSVWSSEEPGKHAGLQAQKLNEMKKEKKKVNTSDHFGNSVFLDEQQISIKEMP